MLACQYISIIVKCSKILFVILYIILDLIGCLYTNFPKNFMYLNIDSTINFMYL